jgi:hypothetical protein
MAEQRKRAGKRGRDASPPDDHREIGDGERLFVHDHRGRCDEAHSWQTFGVSRGLRLVACGVCGLLKPGQRVPVWHQPAAVAEAAATAADSDGVMGDNDSVEA